MKTLRFSLMVLGLVLVTGCSNTRITTASEYDSVYFTSKDKIGGGYAQNDDDDNNNSNRNGNQYANDSREDDFQYSRRLRRFSSTTTSSNWRYYDPYFSNDLYYAMGTPQWNTWNSYGWYNCNSPYLGSPYGYSGYNNYYNNWGGGSFYSPYYSMGSYNPWMNNYYGYTPYCGGGYYGYNPYGGYYSVYNNYYNNGFNNYNNYNNVGYNTPKNVWHHGSTSSFVNSTAATNGGNVRPTPTTHGLKSTSLTHTSPNPTNGTVGETNYLKPRSNQEFNNQPPRTFTPSEMKNSGWSKNNAPANSEGVIRNNGNNTPTIHNNNNTTPRTNNGGWEKNTTPKTNNGGWEKNPAPIRNNNTPTVRPQAPAPTPRSNNNWNSGSNNHSSGGNSGFSRPSGGSSNSSSGGGRRSK